MWSVAAFSPAGAAKLLEGKVILIDAGHAVKNEQGVIINPGARGRNNGVYERDVALNVADTMVPLLEAQGAKVFMTRTRANPWRYNRQKSSDNRGRAILANLLRVDAYVRIHCDWNRDRRFKGFTTYYYRWRSREFAKALEASMAKALPNHRDNGMKRRSFVSVTAQMPAVLIELGVLSNKEEGKMLADDTHQAHLAMALTDGIVTYFEQHP